MTKSSFVENLNYQWRHMLEEDKLMLLTECGDENLIRVAAEIEFMKAEVKYSFEGGLMKGDRYSVELYRVFCKYRDVEFELNSLPFEILQETNELDVIWFVDGELDFETYYEAKYSLGETRHLHSITGLSSEGGQFLKRILGNELLEAGKKTVDFDLHDMVTVALGEALSKKEKKIEEYWNGILKEGTKVEVEIAYKGIILKIDNVEHDVLPEDFTLEL